MDQDVTAGKLKVFVSYSRKDVQFADQLVQLLEDRGYAVMIDRHDIDAADKWKSRLGNLIFSCDKVVFILDAAFGGVSHLRMGS